MGSRLLMSVASIFVLLTMPVWHSHAETFSSSTNFIRTLVIGTNEAIFIKNVKHGGTPPLTSLLATFSRSNQVIVAPISIAQIQLQTEHQRKMLAFAGPAEIQFQSSNVIIEFQRVQTTNVHTVFFNGSNGVAINIPAGRTANFISPHSWNSENSSFGVYPTAIITLSNNITVLKDSLYGDESFSGPLTITLFAGSTQIGNSFTDGWTTYYYTEDFAALPNLNATIVPAGKGIITIEKSLDLSTWSPVFFKPITSEQAGFFRFNFSK